jgi:two-component system chemotaxis response regulator CheY
MAKKILIVDDSSTVRNLVKVTLHNAGYEVVEAGDGEQALAKLNEGRVHMVICDVNMPKMDGFGFLKNVKLRADCKFTPVVMLTTEEGEATKKAGKDAGAKGWMVKPFQPDRLLEVVSKVVG